MSLAYYSKKAINLSDVIAAVMVGVNLGQCSCNAIH
jgi:hypothetical protein